MKILLFNSMNVAENKFEGVIQLQIIFNSYFYVCFTCHQGVIEIQHPQQLRNKPTNLNKIAINNNTQGVAGPGTAAGCLDSTALKRRSEHHLYSFPFPSFPYSPLLPSALINRHGAVSNPDGWD